MAVSSENKVVTIEHMQQEVARLAANPEVRRDNRTRETVDLSGDMLTYCLAAQPKQERNLGSVKLEERFGHYRSTFMTLVQDKIHGLVEIHRDNHRYPGLEQKEQAVMTQLGKDLKNLTIALDQMLEREPKERLLQAQHDKDQRAQGFMKGLVTGMALGVAGMFSTLYSVSPPPAAKSTDTTPLKEVRAISIERDKTVSKQVE